MGFSHIEEQEDYMFAMAFLMPDEQFIKIANKYTTFEDTYRCDVKKVAEHFKVPIDKAYERGQMLSLWK